MALEPDAPWKLSAFAGPEVHEGWHHSDVRWWPGYQHDSDPTLATWDHVGPIVLPTGAGGLPWDDLTFHGAVALHGLQMLPYVDLVPALVELRRVLVHGGTLRLSVPDLCKAYEEYAEGDPAYFQVADELEPSTDGKFCLYVSQAGATRSVFTLPWLIDLCRRAGFEAVAAEHGVTKMGPDWLTELDNRPAESLYVDCARR